MAVDSAGYSAVPAGRGTSLVLGTTANTGFEAMTAAESRTAVTVEMNPYRWDRMSWAAGLDSHWMNVTSAPTFLLCGLMYMFQPPMLEYPGADWPAEVGRG